MTGMIATKQSKEVKHTPQIKSMAAEFVLFLVCGD